MTMSQGNNDLRPTGEEAGEFIEEDPEFGEPDPPEEHEPSDEKSAT
jgi:hypothetical protein